MRNRQCMCLDSRPPQNQQAVCTTYSNFFSESWRYVYALLAGTCHQKILLEVFGKNSDTSKATVPCCDACCMNKCQVSDHRSEFEIAADAIDHLGCYSEVKITEWIGGSKQPWMSDKNTQTISFANHCGHSDICWRAFLRKCHVLWIYWNTVLRTLSRAVANMLCLHATV